MATEEEKRESKKENESEKEIRDLPLKEDVKGGNLKSKKRDTTRTGEVDFMRDFD